VTAIGVLANGMPGGERRLIVFVGWEGCRTSDLKQIVVSGGNGSPTDL